MRKRNNDQLSDEPPKKRISPGGNVLPTPIPSGEILTDLTGKQWKLGRVIGQGGFGEIYLASDHIKEPVKSNSPYVIKVESHSNGPLFVEINCLLRIARLDMINNWKRGRNRKRLGMPHYVASGSHTTNYEKLRFLVLPRFEQDLEKIFLAKNKKFNLKTVLLISIQVLEVLEYIHSKGYVHCDIKASNILHSSQTSPRLTKTSNSHFHRDNNPIRACRFRKPLIYTEYNDKNLRNKQRLNYDEDLSYKFLLDHINDELDTDEEEISCKDANEIVMIDYGLATKYRQNDGTHKRYCHDERKAHAGTILFCSIDAHRGVSCRKSDLESLGYNMIYWLISTLPWENDCMDPEIVQEKKEKYLNNIDRFLKECFATHEYPVFLYEYFKYIKSLAFESEPDYNYCIELFENALKDYGYKQDGVFDFDNLEGWGQKPKRAKSKQIKRNIKQNITSGRVPLTLNQAKPVLRAKSNKNPRKINLNWSKLLALDPEEILRQNNKMIKHIHDVSKVRERKITESSDSSTGGTSLLYLDIKSLNPTYAMLDVYNKLRDKNANYKHGKGDFNSELDHCKGYTPAMDLVLTKMNQRRFETETENFYSNVPVRANKRLKNNHKKKVQKHLGVTSTKDTLKRRSHRIRGYGFRG